MAYLLGRQLFTKHSYKEPPVFRFTALSVNFSLSDFEKRPHTCVCALHPPRVHDKLLQVNCNERNLRGIFYKIAIMIDNNLFFLRCDPSLTNRFT